MRMGVFVTHATFDMNSHNALTGRMSQYPIEKKPIFFRDEEIVYVATFPNSS